MSYDFSNCTLCPRNCSADRINNFGLCESGHNVRAAKAQLHYWEEPCLCNEENASGAVFFSCCSLKCCFCQNYNISTQNKGKEISIKRLGEIFLELQQNDAQNINLVNPTHYVPQIIEALTNVKHKLNIPVIYNSSGYEKVETLKMLEGFIDIYLPDLKYVNMEISKKYSKAENYFEYASKAILEMHRQQPTLIWNGNKLEKGLIIRHLILPKCRHDSIEVIDWLHQNLPKESFFLSLMSQYTPNENCSSYPEINRRITTFEYSSVIKKVQECDINGFSQQRYSAQSLFTPDFDLSGL